MVIYITIHSHEKELCSTVSLTAPRHKQHLLQWIQKEKFVPSQLYIGPGGPETHFYGKLYAA